MSVFSKGKGWRIRVKPSAIAVWISFLAFDLSLYTLLLFVAILLHECGHLVALLLCNKTDIGITFSAFGAEITYGGPLVGMGGELFVAGGGILMNVFSCLLILLLAYDHLAGCFFAVASLCLALLNLIPVKGLDGGRLLEGVLLRFLDPGKVYRVMRCISGVCIAGLFVCSLLVIWGSGFNFSLLLFTLYLSLSVLR